MLDGDPQPAGTAWSEHQPVAVLRKPVLRQRLAEQFVVDPKIVDIDSGFRQDRRPAGLEYEDWLVGVRLRNPAANRTAAKPLVLKQAELVEIAEPAHLFQWVERELLRALEPEKTSGRRVEVPLDDLAHVLSEPIARGSKSRIGHGEESYRRYRPEAAERSLRNAARSRGSGST